MPKRPKPRTKHFRLLTAYLHQQDDPAFQSKPVLSHSELIKLAATRLNVWDDVEAIPSRAKRAEHLASLLGFVTLTKKPKKTRATLDVISTDFLRTYEWRKLRYEALKLCDGLCSLCGRGKQHGTRILFPSQWHFLPTATEGEDGMHSAKFRITDIALPLSSRSAGSQEVRYDVYLLSAAELSSHELQLCPAGNLPRVLEVLEAL
jgi:hypothetical protein